MVIKNILTAVDGSPFSDEIINFAAKFAKLEKAKLFITHILEVPSSMPLDADMPEETELAERILDRAADITDKYGLTPEMDVIKSRSVGPGIVDEAKDLKVDLIIIGMSHKPRFGEIFFGSAVNYVLKNSKIPVIVFREELK